MNRDDIIRMARAAGMIEGLRAEDDLPAIWTPISTAELERFAALVAAAEREKVAQWMMQRGYATGHGDTLDDLLSELDWQFVEKRMNDITMSIEAEREECAKVCDARMKQHQDNYGGFIGQSTKISEAHQCAAAIRARGQS